MPSGFGSLSDFAERGPTLHDESRAAARSQRVHPSQPPSTELLMRVVQFIMSHLDGDLSVAALARRFSLKDRVLLTAFESHTGIALGQFVLRRRLERALDFLKNATASDSEIAMGLGWGSASAFRTAVVNYLGVSPTEYRTSLPPKQAATGLGRRKRPCKSVRIRREESVGQALPAFVV